MTNLTQHGYLVLADISGYTSYLAGVELDHAHEILTDLLETIVNRFKSLLVISKLEGDAVFAYAPESSLPRGETLLDLLESTYIAFRDRQTSMHHRTTCECGACRAIPSLDLKFFAHHGNYLLQPVAGVTEVIGSDVNLAHRLMKNHVSEATGWRAYALFTEQALAHMGLRPEGMYLQPETYEHLGEVATHSLNLHPRYKEIVEARRVFLMPEETQVVMEFDYAASPSVVWEWFNDPRKRGQWMQSEIRPIARIGGRTGAGARNHCVHGKNEVVVEEVLDIRPFDYFTVAHTPQGLPATLLMTYHFTPAPSGGTHLRIAFKGRIGNLPDWAGRLVANFAINRNIKGHWMLDKIDELIAQSAALDVTTPLVVGTTS